MITGTFTAEDYIAAQRLHRSRVARWYWIAGALVTGGGVAWFYWTRDVNAIALLCAGIGALVGEAVMSFVCLPWKCKRLHAQQVDFGSPFTYRWDESTVEATGGEGAE